MQGPLRRIAVLALVALAGCGGDPPSSVVPADARLYLSVDAPGVPSLVDSASRADVDRGRDLRPWLGDRGAYFETAAGESGLVLAAEDEGAAEGFGRKVTAAGPLRASAIVDGHLVIASSRELLRAAVAAAGGDALADSMRLDVAGEDADGAPHVLLAAERPDALQRQDLLGDDVPVAGMGGGPVTLRTWREDGYERTVITGLPPQPAAPALAGLPAAAELAVASGDLSAGDVLAPLGRWAPRAGLRGVLERHLGAGLLFLHDAGGRLDAEADAAAARRALHALARSLPRRRYRVGVTRDVLRVAPRRHPRAHFVLRVADGRVTLDLGRPGGIGDLAATPRYRDAERRLPGAPTALVAGDGGGYLAVRDATEGGRRVLRIVRFLP